ncbi:MAG TPA: winged helix-turn-helix domain-containing protein, partial [Candidatus Binatia bacterium]|nr:winged helix-turn-helix domain-containing protein [Candidatus Binatia bacterium]
MQTDRLLTFGSYRLDPHTGQLWRGKQEVRLTGKASAVLCYLVARAGQMVTKDELFAAVWPETVVSDAALTSCIQELRQALKDASKQPRYLKTIHRRGFQFIGTVVSSQDSGVSRKGPANTSQLATGNWQLTTPIVGRESELARLHGWLEKALHGERQLIFVTGGPGIGKTTVVETFLGQVVGEEELWIGRGQCIEHYGVGEAYLPVLEALGRLCREADGQDVIALLRHQA